MGGASRGGRRASARARLQGGAVCSPAPPMMGPIELESEPVSTLDAPAFRALASVQVHSYCGLRSDL